MREMRFIVAASLAFSALAAPAQAELLDFDGTFFASGAISTPEISGSWTLSFDDQIVLDNAASTQFFEASLTSFSMTPDPLGLGGGFGAVSFDESNTLAFVVYSATGDFLRVDVVSNVLDSCGTNAPFCPVTFGMTYNAGGSLESIQWSDGDAQNIPTDFFGSVVITSRTPTIGDLVEQVLALNIDNGISNSLDAKLSAALSAIDDMNAGNDVAAINSLMAFINAVEAQRGKKIEEGDACDLIQSADAIIVQLGGTSSGSSCLMP